MTEEPTGHDAAAHWEDVAGNWTRWARSPGHDAFWAYRDAFRQFVPAAGRSTLEIGCGEGRIARELSRLGHQVTATDISPTLLAAAEQAGSAHRYEVADASALPFAVHSFDRVVAYNVLMDVPDMAAAVAEAARVLTADGVLTMSVVHPFSDRGCFTTSADDAPFTMTGSYFGWRHFNGTETRDGHDMHFAGWSRPLEDYIAALHGAGLVITELREPRPDPAAARAAAVQQWDRMPLFLWINAEHGRDRWPDPGCVSWPR